LIREEARVHGAVSGPARTPAPAYHIVLVTLAFLAVAYLMERVSYGATYNRIILAGLIVSVAWFAALLLMPSYCGTTGLRDALWAHWKTGIMKSGDLAPFFIAMGAFSGGLERSGLMENAGPALSGIAVSVGPAALVAVPILLVALGLVGIHPFITIVLFGKILEGAAFPVPPLTIALLLAVGGVVSYTVSPLTGIIMPIAKLVDAKASDVALRWNWLFCVIFMAIGIAFAFAWGAVFGAAA